MNRFLVVGVAAMLLVSAIAEVSQAQLLRGRRARGCCPQPACCEAPAPSCCAAPAPTCCEAPVACCKAAPACCEVATASCCEPCCDPCSTRRLRRAHRCCESSVVTASCNSCCGSVSAGCPSCSTTVDSGEISEGAPNGAPPAPVPDAGS